MADAPYTSSLSFPPMSRTPQTKLFHFSSSSEGLQQNGRKARATDFFSPLRFNRLSTQIQHSAIEKGKSPVRGGEFYDNPVAVSHSRNGIKSILTRRSVQH